MKKALFTLALLLICSFGLAQMAFDLIQFSDSTKYGWQDWNDRSAYRTDILNRQKLLHIYEMEAQSLTSNVLKSAIVPGWGQFSTKHFTRGQAILGAELLLFGTSLYFYDQSQEYYQKYESATQVDDIENYYKKAQQPYQFSLIFLGFATIIWGYNIFDVIQSTEAYNASVWDKINRDLIDHGVQIKPDGVEVRF